MAQANRRLRGWRSVALNVGFVLLVGVAVLDRRVGTAAFHRIALLVLTAIIAVTLKILFDLTRP
jgi:hypothetical protein